MTNKLPQTADCIIIGGGVMGASTAYHLTQKGMRNVLLLEKDEFFGLGATGRCAGGIRYQFATEVNIELSKASLPLLERFKEEMDQDIDHNQCGYLFLLNNEKDVKQFERNVALQHKMGIETEWLSSGEVRQRLPQMQLEDIRAATFHGRDGLCDPNSVVMGYIKQATKLGATCLTGIEVTGIIPDKGRVKSVETNQGTVSSPLVLNAAGPWSALIGTMAGIDIPVTPVRRQMLTTNPLPDIPEDFPMVIDFEQSLYFHCEGEGLLTGMSNPGQSPGYDQDVDEDWQLVNLEKAIERMPMLERAGLQSNWAGLYEVTPDAHPIYGTTDLEGFYVVGGFSGHGFMHGPISGKLMSEIMFDGNFQTVDVSMLDLKRFEENRLIQEYNVI
jgi:sarcosine oxidase subunit beta